MTIGPWPGEELVGKQVVVENHHATFVGKAVAVSNQPSILIQERDGARIMLPLANARLADSDDDTASEQMDELEKLRARLTHWLGRKIDPDWELPTLLSLDELMGKRREMRQELKGRLFHIHYGSGASAEERDAAAQAMTDFQKETDLLRIGITGERMEEIAEARQKSAKSFSERFRQALGVRDSMPLSSLIPSPGSLKGRMGMSFPDLDQRASLSAADALREKRASAGRELHEVENIDDIFDVPREAPKFVDGGMAPVHLASKTRQELWQEALDRARDLIDLVKPYAVVGTPESRMTDVVNFAKSLSWARRNHKKRSWETTLDDLAIWQVHYDRAVRAYTDPFDQKGGPRV